MSKSITETIPQTVTQEQVNEALSIWTSESPNVNIKVAQRTTKWFNYFVKCTNLHDVDQSVSEVLSQHKYTKLHSATADCKKELAKFLKYFSAQGSEDPLVQLYRDGKKVSQALTKKQVEHADDISEEQITEIIETLEKHVSETWDAELPVYPSETSDTRKDKKHNHSFKTKYGDFLAMMAVKLAVAGLRNDAGLIMTRRVSTGKGWYPSYYTRQTGIIKYRTFCKKTHTWDVKGFEYQCNDFERSVLELLYNEVPNRYYLFSPSQVSPADHDLWKDEVQNIMNQFGVAMSRASEIAQVDFTTYSFRREKATQNIEKVLQATTPEQYSEALNEAVQTAKNMGHSLKTAIEVYHKNSPTEPKTRDMATQTSELPEGRLSELSLEQLIIESAEQVCRQKLKKILCSILAEL